MYDIKKGHSRTLDDYNEFNILRRLRCKSNKAKDPYARQCIRRADTPAFAGSDFYLCVYPSM